MARERSHKLKAFTVRLPAHYEPALGKLADPECRHRLGVFCYLTREAIKPLYDAFSPEEWNRMALALGPQMDDVRIPPETPNPGAVLASLVEAGFAGGSGEASAEGGKSVGQRLSELDTVSAWAVWVAVQFWFDKREYVEADTRWWELGVRAEICRARDEAEGEG